jgi:hypothetical protein
MRKMIIGALVGALLATAAVALADHDLNRKRPPRLRLMHHGDVLQRVSAWSYCWSYTTERWGVGECTDGSPRYPEAAVIEGSPRVVLRIPYSEEPSRLSITAYRKIREEHGYEQTVGEGEKIGYRLKPHRERGHVSAWDAIFRLDQPNRDYYLNVYARLHQGDPAYALHART